MWTKQTEWGSPGEEGTASLLFYQLNEHSVYSKKCLCPPGVVRGGPRVLALTYFVKFFNLSGKCLKACCCQTIQVCDKDVRWRQGKCNSMSPTIGFGSSLNIANCRWRAWKWNYGSESWSWTSRLIVSSTVEKSLGPRCLFKPRPSCPGLSSFCFPVCLGLTSRSRSPFCYNYPQMKSDAADRTKKKRVLSFSSLM